jgi:hypothetical protein
MKSAFQIAWVVEDSPDDKTVFLKVYQRGEVLMDERLCGVLIKTLTEALRRIKKK